MIKKMWQMSPEMTGEAGAHRERALLAQSSVDALAIFCVIPTFKAASTIVGVIEQTLPYVQGVIVVDDACPEGSAAIVRRTFGADARVHLVERVQNGGVGAAVKSGIALALSLNADVIVKLDADGQMSPSFIDDIAEVFTAYPSTALVKGNRFFDASVIAKMPRMRFIGNAVLSLLVKGASGYWNTIDPTNGYVAFNAHLLRELPWEKFADSYFFEMSVLGEFGIKRFPIVEMEMPAVYENEQSSLSILRVTAEFPLKILRMALRRLFLQYVVFDINLGTMYFVIGLGLALAGASFGIFEWVRSIETGIARTTGTVMLAVLPFLMGFQLMLNALIYDVQFSQRTYHQYKELTTRRRASLSRKR